MWFTVRGRPTASAVSDVPIPTNTAVATTAMREIVTKTKIYRRREEPRTRTIREERPEHHKQRRRRRVHDLSRHLSSATKAT